MIKKLELTGNFIIDINNFEKLSREVGYYNCKANIKDDKDKYNISDQNKYSKLREKQLDMIKLLIEKYNNTL